MLVFNNKADESTLRDESLAEELCDVGRDQRFFGKSIKTASVWYLSFIPK